MMQTRPRGGQDNFLDDETFVRMMASERSLVAIDRAVERPSSWHRSRAPFGKQLPGPGALLAAETARGEKLLQGLADVDDAEVERFKAQHRAVLDGTSLVSGEAGWGFQKNGRPFVGYKVVANCDEHELLGPEVSIAIIAARG